jgi:hypothetical protein
VQLQIRGVPGETPVEAFCGKRRNVFGGGWGEGMIIVAIAYGEIGDPTYAIVRFRSDASNVLSILGSLPAGATIYGALQAPCMSCVQTIPFDADHVSIISSGRVDVYRKSLRDGDEADKLPHEENEIVESTTSDVKTSRVCS